MLNGRNQFSSFIRQQFFQMQNLNKYFILLKKCYYPLCYSSVLCLFPSILMSILGIDSEYSIYSS